MTTLTKKILFEYLLLFSATTNGAAGFAERENKRGSNDVSQLMHSLPFMKHV